jgi:hypothetical protein
MKRSVVATLTAVPVILTSYLSLVQWPIDASGIRHRESSRKGQQVHAETNTQQFNRHISHMMHILQRLGYRLIQWLPPVLLARQRLPWLCSNTDLHRNTQISQDHPNFNSASFLQNRGESQITARASVFDTSYQSTSTVAHFTLPPVTDIKQPEYPRHLSLTNSMAFYPHCIRLTLPGTRTFFRQC